MSSTIHCHVLTPITDPVGKRVEPGEEIHLTPAQYKRLVGFGAVETMRERDVNAAAAEKVELIRKDAERKASGAVEEAEAEADAAAATIRARVEALAKVRVEDLDKDQLKQLGDELALTGIDYRKGLTSVRAQIRKAVQAA